MREVGRLWGITWGEIVQRELWTKEDLLNALRATYYAGIIAQPGVADERASSYRAGFTAALTAIAIHLGLPPAPPITQTTEDNDAAAPRTRIVGKRKGEDR